MTTSYKKCCGWFCWDRCTRYRHDPMPGTRKIVIDLKGCVEGDISKTISEVQDRNAELHEKRLVVEGGTNCTSGSIVFNGDYVTVHSLRAYSESVIPLTASNC